MGFLDGLKAIFASHGGEDANARWLYVRCKRCGTPLAVRVDMRNEPSNDYETGGYVLHKEMMDSRCYELMRAVIHFDAQHHITSQSIENGEFITKEEYEKKVESP